MKAGLKAPISDVKLLERLPKPPRKWMIILARILWYIVFIMMIINYYLWYQVFQNSPLFR